MQKSELQQVLEDILDDGDIEYEIQPYIGRGTFWDKECLAIVTNVHLFNISVKVGVSFKSHGYDWWEIPAPRQDSIGLSTVYYWPSILYVKDEDDGHSSKD